METNLATSKGWRINISNKDVSYKGETFYLTNDELNIMTANRVFDDLIKDTETEEVLLSISETLDGKYLEV